MTRLEHRQKNAPADPPAIPGNLERRVLILAPLSNDAQLAANFLQKAGLEGRVCHNAEELCAQATSGCGAWLLAEEALNERAVAHFREWLDAQPSWSDMPIVLITGGGEVSLERRRRLSSFGPGGNVNFLERPFRPGTLVSTVEVALRSRARQREVSRLLAQIRSDAESLRLADQRKNEFLAMLAHELRNPLSSVTHAARLLVDGADESEHHWAAGVIERQAGQLARLVDDLLEISRITQGKIELRRCVCDAAESLANACETVAPLIAEREHTLLAQFQRQTLWVNADPTRLEQIVVNLLANAVKYMKPRGQIWLDGQQISAEIVIRVRDSGIGIPPERIPEMFELFAQGERSAARSEGGLGIGLTVVRGLCEMHGGSITAESAGCDQGSTFTVRLPAVPAPKTSTTDADHGNGASPAASARILVVDDNRDTAQALARLLRRRGYEVELAHDGTEALARALPFSPHAVLLDIGLPEMDGYEVARLLRTQAGCGQAFIVALTGYGQEEDRARARASGFDHHLVKPVDIDRLHVVLGENLPCGK